MKSHAAFQDGMPFFQAPLLKGTFCRRTVFYSTPASFYTPPDLFRRARCIPRPAPERAGRRTRDGQAVIFVVPLLPKRPRGKTGKRQSGKICLSPPAAGLTTYISPRRADFRVFRQAFLQKGRQPRAAAPCNCRTAAPELWCVCISYFFTTAAAPWLCPDGALHLRILRPACADLGGAPIPRRSS